MKGRKTGLTISRVYIDTSIADSPKLESFLARTHAPFEVVEDARTVFEAIEAADDPIEKAKHILYLTRNRGAFIRDCPGTRNYTCCGYRILHIGTFCIMDCSYCILQSYFHPPVLQYFLNHEDMCAELDAMFAEKQTVRIGTGEFTDSMIWELWTDLSSFLVPRFASQRSCILELKTKATTVQPLQWLAHNRKTIMAWSVNADAVIRNEERNTSSLSARLKAAALCQSWGYPLAFHFDPMILYEGCEREYLRAAEQIFSAVDAGNVVWISMGAFRFMPALKPIIQKRFPASKIVYGEFIPGLDAKMRYFKPLRIELYRKLASRIREIAPNVRIYLCMESDEVWEKTFGYKPADLGGLPFMLDQSAREHCGLE
ncbi:MAG: DNA photolyase [Desulfobacterales bacterium]|nr:DNA photolyase [Desulfobacterales bacterium]MDD3951474.1 DNA photolyase [Desulfobacterales bacterium]